jgi:protocatechuate 3,4-dioxygenase alpha subunit
MSITDTRPLPTTPAAPAEVELVASPSQTVGPFFHFGMTTDASLGRLAGQGAAGERIRLRVRVLDGEGVPVPDAMVEIWQADADGAYVVPGRLTERPAFVSYGRLPTDESGVCTFDTIRPGRVPDQQGARQASHVNICLFARGLLRQLHTRVYFAGDPYLGEDAALALVPAERRDTLLAAESAGEAGLWTFDLRLQGERETVFFSV